jgi:DNA-binding winged helix-turn-helix (wHTH) protein
MPSPPPGPRRFGIFELDVDAAAVRRQGRRVKMQPQPFKLLVLLTDRPGSLISREEIRTDLWPDGTFVDFDQSVNFAIKQIRDALGDSADRPTYIETVPRKGYRFIAPVETAVSASPAATPRPEPRPEGTTVRLQKAMWANIAELRQTEARLRSTRNLSIAALVIVLAVVLFVVLRLA